MLSSQVSILQYISCLIYLMTAWLYKMYSAIAFTFKLFQECTANALAVQLDTTHSVRERDFFFFSRQHTHCSAIIDVCGKNSVILYVPNTLSSSAEHTFDFISRRWFVTRHEEFLSNVFKFDFSCHCNATGAWLLQCPHIYFCVWLSKEGIFL